MKKLNIKVNGTIYQVEIEEVETFGDVVDVSEGSAIREEIVAPMPGNISKLNFKIGDIVDVGDTLVILEAMKMGNEIKVSNAGKISEINVKEGDNVETGDVLAVIN